MFRRYSVNYALFSIVLDALLVATALAVATNTRPLLNALPFAETIKQPLPVPLLLYLVFPLAWVLILLLLSVYDGRRNLRVIDELTSLTIGSLLAGVSLGGMLYLSYREISRVLFLVFLLLAYLAMVMWRLIARLSFNWSNGKSTSYRRVLIAGAGPVGRQLQEQIIKNSFMGLTITGFLDDDHTKRVAHKDILGSLNDALRVVSQQEIDDVVIALPGRAYDQVNRLVAELHNLPVKVWVIPDYFHLALHKAVIQDFAGLPMLDLRAPALNEYQRMMKRAFDLLMGCFFQITASPLLAIIALAIKLDTPGPALFKQERVGENGRLFGMYKFRTMVKDADKRLSEVMQYDDEGNLIHKRPDDPRVTRVGRFLRRTSLDELPQLINVLKGEMSLVGPRPELPVFVEQYQPWQRKRFAVPQGITGWWQVNGRSDKPMHLYTEADLFYVQNYSLMLDLYILLKTVWVVLRGRGAY